MGSRWHSTEEALSVGVLDWAGGAGRTFESWLSRPGPDPYRRRRRSGGPRVSSSLRTMGKDCGDCSNTCVRALSDSTRARSDEFDLDEVIHRYKRTAARLWAFCGSSRATSSAGSTTATGTSPGCIPSRRARRSPPSGCTSTRGSGPGCPGSSVPARRCRSRDGGRRRIPRAAGAPLRLRRRRAAPPQPPSIPTRRNDEVTLGMQAKRPGPSLSSQEGRALGRLRTGPRRAGRPTRACCTMRSRATGPGSPARTGSNPPGGSSIQSSTTPAQ